MTPFYKRGEKMVTEYVTVEECNSIVKEQYLKNDVERMEWEKLDSEDKLTLIKRTTIQFNNLPWSGYPNTLTQPIAFPRTLFNTLHPIRRGFSDVYICEVPLNVKFAFVNEMVSLYANSKEQKETEKKLTQGVKSISLNDIMSESYDLDFLEKRKTRQFGLFSETAFTLLQGYIGGVFDVI